MFSSPDIELTEEFIILKFYITETTSRRQMFEIIIRMPVVRFLSITLKLCASVGTATIKKTQG